MAVEENRSLSGVYLWRLLHIWERLARLGGMVGSVEWYWAVTFRIETGYHFLQTLFFSDFILEYL